jgi:hypothetical protein
MSDWTIKYKFVSENMMEHLSLHDCVINKAYVKENDLIFEFDHLDVLPTHPLNNYLVAKCSGKAEIIFEKFALIHSILYDTSKVSKKHIKVEEDAEIKYIDILELVNEFEVLKIEEESEKNLFVYEFHGTASLIYRAELGCFKITSKNIKICWNELNDDAWFVRSIKH